MPRTGMSHVLEVWGDFACFTSPMKVERWSYPFITPSAARGVFDAIFVNPHEFRWEIQRIEILREPEYIALMRNEVKEKVSTGEIIDWMKNKKPVRPILADANKYQTGTDKKGRTPRQTMALKDVRYRLTARIRTIADPSPKPLAAYDEQFMRRARRGQHFCQPVLGCREFPAFWSYEATGEAPICKDIDAGWMLFDVFDLGLGREGAKDDKACISVFRAKAEKGIVEVPQYSDERVRKGGLR